jgi:hypothetical protein
VSLSAVASFHHEQDRLMHDPLETWACLRTLLSIIVYQRIIEPDIDAGIARFAAAGGSDIAPETWRKAVSQAVRAGYIHDPVRLEAGVLQCRWHLKLTAQGVETLRHLSPTNDVYDRC